MRLQVPHREDAEEGEGITNDLTDPEYEAAVHLAAAVAFTARYGPSPDEVAGFTPWKRAIHAVTPRRHRWRLSQYAPIIRRMPHRPTGS